jgi:hypothetical protein
MKQTFFLRSVCLGSREVPPTWESDLRSTAGAARFPYTNVAFFCPVCGEVWGRVTHEGGPAPADGRDPWLCEFRTCGRDMDRHGELGRWKRWTAGSFLFPFPEVRDQLSFADDWPEEVIRHECGLLLRKLQDGIEGDTGLDGL